MERRIRFSLNAGIEPTVTDSSPGVKYGILEDGTVIETASLWSGNRGAAHPFDAIRLLPPCSPSKIVCVGRNYSEHARELGNEVPEEPLIFLKPPSSLIASGDNILYPPNSRRVDFEGELGVIIGRRARRVTAAEAEDYVGGYTCVNDVTARDLQKQDKQWTRGKGFDTFCAVGPWFIPRDAVDFNCLRVRTVVDGETKQDAPVTEMIFPVNVILEYVSQFMTLEPGDLIATGTPPGVGPLQIGSTVLVDIEGIGVLRNQVTQG